MTTRIIKRIEKVAARITEINKGALHGTNVVLSVDLSFWPNLGYDHGEVVTPARLTSAIKEHLHRHIEDAGMDYLIDKIKILDKLDVHDQG